MKPHLKAKVPRDKIRQAKRLGRIANKLRRQWRNYKNGLTEKQRDEQFITMWELHDEMRSIILGRK